MTSAKPIVLGSGIAGLIAGYLDPKSVVIGDDPGGSMKSALSLGPRFLHATPSMLEFIDEVGLKAGPQEKLRIKFQPPFSRLIYNVRTRGISHLDVSEEAAMPDRTVVKTPTVVDLVRRLVELLGDRLTTGRVNGVDVGRKEIFIQGVGAVAYSSLVSTIPAPAFFRLTTEARSRAGAFLSIPVRFCYYPIDEWPYEADYVYFGTDSPSVPYTRISLVKDESTGLKLICAEYPGLDSEAKRTGSCEKFPDIGPVFCSDEILVQTGRLVSRSIFQVPDVRFFGRFGEWQDWILMHNLVRGYEKRREEIFES